MITAFQIMSFICNINNNTSCFSLLFTFVIMLYSVGHGSSLFPRDIFVLPSKSIDISFGHLLSQLCFLKDGQTTSQTNRIVCSYHNLNSSMLALINYYVRSVFIETGLKLTHILTEYNNT